MRLALTALILTIIWVGTAFAQLVPGDALVIESGLGGGGPRLWRVDLTPGPTFGDRVIISDFDNAAQGPKEFLPQDLILDGSSGDALVVSVFRDEPGFGLSPGDLFSVDLTTGFRAVISNFNDAAQGPKGLFLAGVTLDGSGDALVIDQGFIGPPCGQCALFRVDLNPGPTFGDRVIISDFNDGAQGPTGVVPRGVALDGSGDALVIDSDAGTNGRGRYSGWI